MLPQQELHNPHWEEKQEEELFFEKEKVKRLLNENLGKKYIKEIKLN